MSSKKYDYIIAGVGLAGLSLLIHLAKNAVLKDKRILLLDPDEKNTNDRTWSFWKRKSTVFDQIISKTWSTGIVNDSNEVLQMALTPYVYATIQGIDFYEYGRAIVQELPTVQWKKEAVTNIQDDGTVTTDKGTYHGELVFDSTYQKELFKVPSDKLLLWQHFKGEVVETESDFFDTSQAVLMDFDTPQHGQTRFFYLLPYSSRKALIEYTIFSDKILPESAYDIELTHYKERIGLPKHRLLEKELSAIPMTDANFPFQKGKVIYMGTKGGFVKASSGYTFNATQNKIQRIIQILEKGEQKIDHRSPKKFRFYDHVLLHVLHDPKINSPAIFMSMFKKLGAANMFSFLDEETHFLEDLRVILSVPNKFKFKFAKYLPLWRKVK